MIKFYGILDFFPNRIRIKEEFDKLTIDERITFKKYVYSLCFEKEHVKDLIWEFLNNWTESQEELSNQWKIKKDKLEKRINNESNDTT